MLFSSTALEATTAFGAVPYKRHNEFLLPAQLHILFLQAVGPAGKEEGGSSSSRQAEELISFGKAAFM